MESRILPSKSSQRNEDAQGRPEKILPGTKTQPKAGAMYRAGKLQLPITCGGAYKREA
jgi:hypothetical protein